MSAVKEPVVIAPTVTVKTRVGPKWTTIKCHVRLGADQPGHIPRYRARNKAEAWEMCRQEGAKLGVKDHQWRKNHHAGACYWYAYILTEKYNDK